MGLPTRAEITARYAERTGIDTSDATWYEAFAQWKTGVVVQQLHRRWERGESTDPRMEFVADRLPLLVGDGVAAARSAGLDSKRPSRSGGPLTLVAGAGFEPATFGL